MIVCLCRGLSERDIRAVVAAGACTTDAVTDACGAGTDCGACRIMLADLIAEMDAPQLAAGARA